MTEKGSIQPYLQNVLSNSSQSQSEDNHENALTMRVSEI